MTGSDQLFVPPPRPRGLRSAACVNGVRVDDLDLEGDGVNVDNLDLGGKGVVRVGDLDLGGDEVNVDNLDLGGDEVKVEILSVVAEGGRRLLPNPLSVDLVIKIKDNCQCCAVLRDLHVHVLVEDEVGEDSTFLFLLEGGHWFRLLPPFDTF